MPKLAWSPQQGPQTSLVESSLPEVFFGGARGGGKTDGVLGKWAIKERKYGADFNAIMFRRTQVSSEDAIERSKAIYTPLGAKWSAPRWRMPNGGRIGFAYLDSVNDAQEYQGRNVTDAWVEEAGQYSTPDPIMRLFGVLRSAEGVPIQLILTANPGGAGQHWIRSRYELHPFPLRPRRLLRPIPDGTVHQVGVIPSRIRDNRILMESDPGYISRLHMVGSAALVKAWLEGDWTAIEGAYFDCWSERNIVPPFAVPKDWVRFRSGDWGSFSPFSIGWWAVVQDDYGVGPSSGEGDHYHPSEASGWQNTPSNELHKKFACHLPRGALVRYREWYGSKDPAQSDIGLKLTAEEVADGIIRLERDDPKLAYAVMDPSVFKEDGGPSIGERINARLLFKQRTPFHAADNTRVPTTRDRRGAMSGWDQMRSRIIGRGTVPSNTPMIYTFATNVASIRTIPVLQHDPAKPEDLDTESLDHCADDWRYACSSRPWTRFKPVPDVPKDAYRPARDDVNEYIDSSVKLL
jgi:Phage terminase large subunit